MKLQIFSDLHIEFGDFKPPEAGADVIVLAGDIHVGRNGLKWAIQAFPQKPIIYVLGNHEYYGHALPKLTRLLEEDAKSTNVQLLENSEWVFEGVRFLGCTLWTDFRLYGDPMIAGFEAQQVMIDYRKIRISPRYSRLRPADTIRLHAESKSWLKHKLEQDFAGPTVVISHHAPSLESVPAQWKEDIVSAAFASNLTDFILKSGADLWVHGHIHSHADYRIGKTRVICNPRGYPGEGIRDFDPGLVVQL